MSELAERPRKCISPESRAYRIGVLKHFLSVLPTCREKPPSPDRSHPKSKRAARAGAKSTGPPRRMPVPQRQRKQIADPADGAAVTRGMLEQDPPVAEKRARWGTRKSEGASRASAKSTGPPHRDACAAKAKKQREQRRGILHFVQDDELGRGVSGRTGRIRASSLFSLGLRGGASRRAGPRCRPSP